MDNFNHFEDEDFGGCERIKKYTSKLKSSKKKQKNLKRNKKFFDLQKYSMFSPFDPADTKKGKPWEWRKYKERKSMFESFDNELVEVTKERINTYSGVTTEEDLKEIYGEKALAELGYGNER